MARPKKIVKVDNPDVKEKKPVKQKPEKDNVQPEFDENGVLIQKNVFPPAED